MKKQIWLVHALTAILPVFLMGCAYLHSTTSKDKYGIETTKTTVYTLFDSKSDMTKYRASITDKTSGTTIGAIDQSAATTTNFTGLVQAIVEAAVRAAKTP